MPTAAFRILFSTAVACIAASAGAVFAADGEYTLFPVAGIFVARTNDPSASKIDRDFSFAVPPDRGGKFFEEKFRATFPDAAKTINDANKRRTFAVSLQIARASKYIVKKPDGTDDVYLPVTGSIYFTNLLTGEVLFTLNRTEIKVATVKTNVASEGSNRVRELYRENFEELTESLIKEAKSQFHPSTISAVVRSNWKGLAILDGGREQGISREDTLMDKQGNELLVLSSGPSYSIAKVQLGAFSKGTNYSKVSNQTLAEIRKPRVLALIDKSPSDFPETALIQLLSDALGAKSSISLVPVNKTFQAVLTTFASKVDISQEKLRQRELPNFFFRLNVPEPIEYEVPTNLPHKTRRIYEATALGSLVDRSGRVLYAGIGKNTIEDEVTSGIAFNSAARREIVVKNALIDLSNRFANDMKFSDAEVPVTRLSDSQIAIRDDHGMLARGSNWRLYRSIGKVNGINGDVRVPTWEIAVQDVIDNQAQASLDLPIVDGAPKPEAGDVVFLNGVSGDGFVTRKRFNACPEQKLGALSITGYGDIAQNVFASKFKAAYFTSGLSEKVTELVRAGSGFKSDLKIPNVPADYCVEPVYRVDPAEPKCSDDTCADVASMRLTYRIRAGGVSGEIKVRHGLETKMVAATLPKKSTPAAKTAALLADMIDEAITLNAGIIPSLLTESY